MYRTTKITFKNLVLGGKTAWQCKINQVAATRYVLKIKKLKYVQLAIFVLIYTNIIKSSNMINRKIVFYPSV